MRQKQRSTAFIEVVVNEIRDFVNAFPANLSRLEAARRIHQFLAQVTPKLLQVQAFSPLVA